MAGWLGAALGSAVSSTGLSFAGFYAPSQYFVVLLAVFVILLFACAVVAEYFGTILERLDAQVSAARAEALRSQRLWHTLLAQLPVAAVLLDADTHEVIGASAPAQARFFGGQDPGGGRDFFETIHFTYPEPIQQLVHGAGGVERLSIVRLGDRLLATEIRVQHVAQKGRRFALVIVNDMTEAFCVKAALDVSDHAALVADAEGRVLAFNKPARALFSDAAVGAAVSQLLPQTTAGPRWWDPGLSSRRRLYATIMRRVYQVTASAVVLPGEDARLYVIAFLPAAQVAAGDAGITGSTTVLQRQ
jgi:PAS domain-containing protein